MTTATVEEEGATVVGTEEETTAVVPLAATSAEVANRARSTAQADPGGMLEVMRIAKVFIASQMFSDVHNAFQAAVKIVAGRELGLQPMQSMQGIFIVEGRITLSAGIIATLVKRSGKYDYRIKEHTNEVCVVVIIDRATGEVLGESGFTIQDAQRAGLVKDRSGWVKYPRNMLFSRALTNAVRWHCPDALGIPVMEPDAPLTTDEGDLTRAEVHQE